MPAGEVAGNGEPPNRYSTTGNPPRARPARRRGRSPVRIARARLIMFLLSRRSPAVPSPYRVLVNVRTPIRDRNLVGSVIVTRTVMARLPSATTREVAVSRRGEIVPGGGDGLRGVDREGAGRVGPRYIHGSGASPGGFLRQRGCVLPGGELRAAVGHDPASATSATNSTTIISDSAPRSRSRSRVAGSLVARSAGWLSIGHASSPADPAAAHLTTVRDRV